MGRSVTEFRVLIASPGDLPDARTAAREEILKWNELYSEQQTVRLLPVMWETHSSPEMGDRPQEIINRQIVDSCDIAVGLFWKRLGTPTGTALSGTVEELERMIEVGKPTSIYFCMAPVDPYALRAEEFEPLRDFHEQCKSRGLLSSFTTVEELRDKLRRQLTRQVAELQEKDGSEANVAPPQSGEHTNTPGTVVLAHQALGTESTSEGATGGWYSLLKRGEYKAGMELLRDAFKAGEWKHSTLSDMEGFGRLIAFTEGGEYEAFTDLEKDAAANPSDANLWFWYGIVLKRADREEDALAAFRRVMELAPHGVNHRSAVNSVAITLLKSGRRNEALELWRAEISLEQDPKGRVQYLSRMAEAYEEESDHKNILLASSLRELILEVLPSDDSRLQLAWRYGNEMNSHALALLHYLDALERDADDATATVNAGWAAEQLSLPMTSVQYYSQAQVLKEPLAITNMGWRYLEAGFAKHAEQMVAAAREIEPSSENADRLAVAIRDRLADEANRWSSTREKALKVRPWRARVARAFASPVLASNDFDGAYSGTPASLQLSVDATGAVAGIFFYASASAQFILTGTVSGRLIEFSWNSLPTSAPSLLDTLRIGPSSKAGRGYLVISERRLLGYVFRGSESIDPAGLEDFTEWSLERVQSS